MNQINPECMILEYAGPNINEGIQDSEQTGESSEGRNIKTFCQAGLLKFGALMLLAFYTPVVLIWSEVIPFRYRFHASIILLAVFIIYSLIRRHGLRELGFRTDNLKDSVLWNLLFSAAGSVCLFLTYRAGFLRKGNDHLLPYIYVIYIFFLSPVQEVVFRGIFFAELKKIRIDNPRWVILLSTVSFCFLHLIYRHPPMLVITFASGLVWSLIFTRWPNIWGVSLSHSILGSLAIFLGII